MHRAALLGCTLLGAVLLDTSIVAAQAPAPRSGHAAAYDPIHKRIVIFGGGVNGTIPYPSDTWAWDGARWTQLASSGPAGRDDAVMAYDPLSRGMLLYGGRTFQNRTPSFRTDTWIFDGARWTQRDSTGVGLREHEELVTDNPAQGPLLIGGVDVTNPATFADSWRWGGHSWKRVSDHTLADVVLNGAVALAGAGIVSVGASLGEMAASLAPTHVLELVDGHWVSDTATGPSISPKVPVTAGPTPGSLVLFDAFPPSRVATTWTWQQGRWRQHTGQQPSARRGAAMVYDPERKRVVLIGGDDGNALLADVWEFDGTRWQRVF